MNQEGTASSRRRARVAEIERRERTRRAGRFVAAATLVVPGLTVAALIAVGLGPAPRSSQSAAVEAEPVDVARLDLAPTPAEAALLDVLSSPPSGWSAMGPVAAAASDPLTDGCDVRSPAAALSSARRFQVGGVVLGLRVSAFGAGLGGVAVRDTVAAIETCTGAGARQSSSVGLDAAVAWRDAEGGRPSLGAVVWRRGDVLVSLVVAGRSVDSLAARAGEIDEVLMASLRGRCAETESSPADAARTPYRRDGSFSGLVSPLPVDIAAVADPASGLPSPAPAPTVSFPARPADPVSPSALPTPVAPPVVPFDPGPQPTSTTVAARRPDPVGPGCGWAFLGQVAPVLDEAAEAARVEAAVEQARNDLTARQQQWALARGEMAAQAVVYEQQLAAFLAYAEQVRLVALAWDAVSAARADYALRLAEYEAAVAALDQWWRDRAAAQAAYEAAVDVCSAQPPAAGESPGPVDLPSPTASASSPSLAPTSPGSTCPPALPGILQEAPPVVPPSPVPTSG